MSIGARSGASDPAPMDAMVGPSPGWHSFCVVAHVGASSVPAEKPDGHGVRAAGSALSSVPMRIAPDRRAHTCAHTHTCIKGCRQNNLRAWWYPLHGSTRPVLRSATPRRISIMRGAGIHERRAKPPNRERPRWLIASSRMRNNDGVGPARSPQGGPRLWSGPPTFTRP